MGTSLTTLRCITNAAGVSSLLLSLFPKLIIKNPKILRPLLNVSWGYLFGSTFWLGFFSEIGVIRGIQYAKKKPMPQTAFEAKEALEKLNEAKKDEMRKAVDYQYFFSLSTLFSGILLLSTVRLASQNLQLRICSSVVSVSCLLNSLFLYDKLCKLGVKKENLYHELIDKPQDEAVIAASIRKTRKEFHIFHAMSILSLYVSFFGLTPYIFT